MTVPSMPKIDDKFELTAMVDGQDEDGVDTVGRVFTSVQRPRFSFQDLATRTGEGSRTWLVDGIPRASFEEAEQALDVPPVLTPEEQGLLDELSDQWVLGQDFIGYGDSLVILPKSREDRRSALADTLRSKGLIEWQDRKVRRRQRSQ
jgi:hypothetical protein